MLGTKSPPKYSNKVFIGPHSSRMGTDSLKAMMCVTGNIGRTQDMPMNYNLVCEPFDVWGLDHLGPFSVSDGHTHILVVVCYQVG